MIDFTEFFKIDSDTSTTSIIISGAVIVITLIAQWKIFTKAGESGWKSIIPIYNLYILCKIVDGKGIKFLLFIIPIVNVVYSILICIRMAKAFGRGTVFTLGLIFLNPIFTLILGFGDARYIGLRG